MSELTQAQREAMERARVAVIDSEARLSYNRSDPDAEFRVAWNDTTDGVRQSYRDEVVSYVTRVCDAFLAGLRYQDEVSDEEVEAAARAIYNASNPKTSWVDRYPGQRAHSEREARAALQAAREVRGENDE